MVFSHKNSRSSPKEDFGFPKIDIHSHILFGIDDGSKNLETSLAILDGLKSQGFTNAILTPHYVADTIYTSSRQNNQKILRELKKAWEEHEKASLSDSSAATFSLGHLHLHLGNEIYIDRSISELLKSRTISPLADGKYLLIELPMSGEFDGYEDIFDSLRLEGYQVILAHPERYSSTHHDFSILERLHASGILFQCNYGSFIGQYGKNSKKTAEKLAREKLIFALGTDIHHERDYSEIKKSLKRLSKFYSSSELEDLTTKNPQKILQDLKPNFSAA